MRGSDMRGSDMRGSTVVGITLVTRKTSRLCKSGDFDPMSLFCSLCKELETTLYSVDK